MKQAICITHKITLMLALLCGAVFSVAIAFRDNDSVAIKLRNNPDTTEHTTDSDVVMNVDENDNTTENRPRPITINNDPNASTTSQGHNMIMNVDTDTAGYSNVKAPKKTIVPTKKTVTGLHALGGFDETKKAVTKKTNKKTLKKKSDF